MFGPGSRAAGAADEKFGACWGAVAARPKTKLDGFVGAGSLEERKTLLDFGALGLALAVGYQSNARPVPSQLGRELEGTRERINMGPKLVLPF
jgi:hypothetical protein